MTSKPVLFKDSLVKSVNLVLESGIPLERIVIIRDILGRIRIAVESEKSEFEIQGAALSKNLIHLGAYAFPNEKRVLFKEDVFSSESVFENPEIVEVQSPELENTFRLLDRQVMGQDWLLPKKSGRIPRLVFYGIKGGVGRSTALSIVAYNLAKSGKRVLLIDLDLESPGLSSLLLPKKNRSDYGLVDWLIEDTVGQGDVVFHSMVSSSPIAEQTQGAIRVAAAFGKESCDDDYLSKLSRVYIDKNKNGKVEKFSTTIHRLVNMLEESEQPDVVLIDSRAGIHDLAAISIVNLSTYAYLFGSGSLQSWEGYRLLFSYWKSYPSILKQIRDRLVMIHALFPKSMQMDKADKYLEDSYNLFSETIYESIEPGSIPSLDVFNFDFKDEGAPHFPVRISWDDRFQEFEPILLSKNIITESQLNASFGELLSRINDDLAGLE